VKWTSVETLPEEGTQAVVTGWCGNLKSSGERFYAVAEFLGGDWYEKETGDKLYPPTHYMILEPPK